MSATLKDIADRAEVSIKTVSKVLNSEQQSQRPSAVKRAERIRRIATELNYRPNLLARAMRTNKKMQIGLLVSELYNPQTGRIAQLFERELAGHGYRLMLAMSDSRPDLSRQYLSDFAGGLVDGVINLDPAIQAADLKQHLGDIPSVVYARREEPESPVAIDYEAGSEAAMELLWDLGHRKIGYILGPPKEVGVRCRLAGYHRFWKQKQAEPKKEWIANGNWRFESGGDAVKPLLAQGCTALLIANELMAAAAVRAIRESGLRVPEDISLVASDGSLVGMISDPPLTTLDHPVAQLVQGTIGGLLDQMNGKPTAPQTLIQPKLIERASTAAVKH